MEKKQGMGDLFLACTPKGGEGGERVEGWIALMFAMMPEGEPDKFC